MDPGQVAEIVRDVGSTGLLAIGIIGGFKGWYVWRWQYDAQLLSHANEVSRLDAEKEEWKHIAMRGLEVAERNTE